MWQRSQPLCNCNNCEMNSLKGNMKIQQQELVSLFTSHAQLEQKLHDREYMRDKIMVIVLQKVNTNFDQIKSLRKAI
jgi:hypothetical protein